MVLLIDNYDSFVYNLARYFEELGVEVEVVRNDVVTVAEVVERRAEAIYQRADTPYGAARHLLESYRGHGGTSS